jgi:glycosyltransferase involved in cell wall biosynthesis
MDENTLSSPLTSAPVLQALLQRQVKILDVYRDALKQISSQRLADQAALELALAKIDAVEADNQSLIMQLGDLDRRSNQTIEELGKELAESQNQEALARQQLLDLESVTTLRDALVSKDILRGTTDEDIQRLVDLAQNSADIERQFNDAMVYIASLEEAVGRKDSELVHHQQIIHAFKTSIAYRLFVSPIWKLRRILFPDGSRRANAYFRLRHIGRRDRKSLPVTDTQHAGQLSIPDKTTAQSSRSMPQPHLWKGATSQKRIGTKSPALQIARGSDVVFTSVSKNYLANARALMKSIHDVHPQLALVTVLVDEIDGYFDPVTEPFQTLLASDLGIPNWEHFSMKYDIMELNTAVKPYAFHYLMEKFGAERVIYFDPDILVYRALDPLFDLLEDHLCFLTPHITAPLNDDLSPSEINFLRVGTYNLGFFALSRRGDWRGLLRWWEDRLYEHCTREVERGLFVDQHWMDLVPSLFASVYVLRDPGYNVAYWNLSHRKLTFSAESGYMVNAEPLVFFHFSGFSVRQPEAVSKHQNRFRFENLNEATRQCYLEYRQRLLDQGFEQTSTFPYAYDHFDNGVAITDALRICLRNHDNRGEIWPDPYDLSSPDCFLAWAVGPGNLPPYRTLSPYAITLYQIRADLKAVFPDLESQNELAFASWFVQERNSTDTFSAAYVDPVQYAIEVGGVSPAPSSTSVVERPLRRERLARAARYYREYPTKVKPYLPPEAFTETSTSFGGPNNAYGRTRNALKRVGILRMTKRIVGMRQVMTMREYFGEDKPLRSAGGRPSFAPSFSINQHAESAAKMAYGVTIVGYLHTETGVGEVARNLIRCLAEVQFPVAQYAISSGDVYRQDDQSTNKFATDTNHFVQLFHVNADQAMITKQSLGADFYGGHYNIGYWFWELSNFPECWADAFEIYDEIWVATKFVQDAIQAVSPKPVFCVPPAISVELPPTSSRAQFGLRDTDFVVLFAFDALSIMERKNPWDVVSAFELAFTEQERNSHVRLVIKVTNLDKVPESERLRNEIMRVNGHLIDTYLDRIDVNALISHADVYISLHRSEGFGLTMAEAMVLGKPVIGTAYSGNVDFMHDAHSYPVPFEVIALDKAYPPYEADSVWANPDVTVAARHLRDIYQDPDAAAEKGRLAAAYIREHYNLRSRGRKIAERLDSILLKNFTPMTGSDA